MVTKIAVPTILFIRYVIMFYHKVFIDACRYRRREQMPVKHILKHCMNGNTDYDVKTTAPYHIPIYLFTAI